MKRLLTILLFIPVLAFSQKKWTEILADADTATDLTAGDYYIMSLDPDEALDSDKNKLIGLSVLDGYYLDLIGGDFLNSIATDTLEAGNLVITSGDLTLDNGDITNDGDITATGLISTTGSAIEVDRYGDNTHAAIYIDADDGKGMQIHGRRNTVKRWVMQLGTGDSEGGSNEGSDFNLIRYDDAGALIDTPIEIQREDGIVDFDNAITVTDSVESTFIVTDSIDDLTDIQSSYVRELGTQPMYEKWFSGYFTMPENTGSTAKIQVDFTFDNNTQLLHIELAQYTGNQGTSSQWFGEYVSQFHCYFGSSVAGTNGWDFNYPASPGSTIYLTAAASTSPGAYQGRQTYSFATGNNGTSTTAYCYWTLRVVGHSKAVVESVAITNL